MRARGREWVVLPESEGDFLIVRPLGGTLQETAGIHIGLEQVEPACLSPAGVGRPGQPCLLPAPARCRSLRVSLQRRTFPLLRPAGLPAPALSARPAAHGPETGPVRLLIADDVGIGKTVEACLVARELLDRGEINRICVLCPPHLAEQWQKELASKFNIYAELVLSSTARRLERNLRADQSIFDAHPFVVVSTDFIKSDRRRHDFLRTCPEFVIVDEAHTCAAAVEGRGYFPSALPAPLQAP